MSNTPTYAVPSRFMGIERKNKNASFVIAGIPMDIGTTNRAGTRDGPRAIRQASRMLVDGMHPHWWVDPLTMNITDIGDFQLVLGDIQNSLAAIETQAENLHHLIALGGDHGVTLGLLRALRKKYKNPISLLHFDAHVDTWPDNFGQSYAHGSVFYHAISEGLIEPKHSIQIGIRSPVDKKIWDWTVDQGINIITALDVHENGTAYVADQIIETLSDSYCYMSFDIDALDPAFAPGTGTPEVGGLATWQIQSILRKLNTRHFVGMDVVEVAPAYDHSEITALAAATVVWEYLCLCVS